MESLITIVRDAAELVRDGTGDRRPRRGGLARLRMPRGQKSWPRGSTAVRGVRQAADLNQPPGGVQRVATSPRRPVQGG
jgi:hypothetical protein